MNTQKAKKKLSPNALLNCWPFKSSFIVENVYFVGAYSTHSLVWGEGM